MDSTFQELGYEIVQAEQLGWLEHIQNLVHRDLQRCRPTLVGAHDITTCLNTSHSWELSSADLNQLRLNITAVLTKADIGQMIYDAFPVTITELVGPDVLQQKGANLVIQEPNDKNVAPTHRDAPVNSPFEVVVWVPLTDSYGTKSMRILDRRKTQTALHLLEQEGFESYTEYATIEGESLEVPFGSACFFWTGLVHHIPVNLEQETRWAVNHRYKNFFAPPGTKGNGYMKALHLGPLTTLGIEG